MTKITISDLNPSESSLYELTDEELSLTHGGLPFLVLAVAAVAVVLLLPSKAH